MQELIKKIDQVLRTKFPDYTKEELDEMIEDYGQIAFLESLNKSIMSLHSEEKRYKLGGLISDGKTEEALQYAESEGVDMGAIFEEVSKSIVVEIFNQE